MKYTIYGFNQEKLLENDLKIIDAQLLRFFIDFKDSGAMATETFGDEVYYWVKYEKVIKELPILNLKKSDSVYRRFKKLAKCDILKHKTKRNATGTYSFFTVGPKYFELISNTPYNLKNGTDIIPGGYGYSSEGGTDIHPGGYGYLSVPKDSSTKDSFIKLNNNNSIFDHWNQKGIIKHKKLNQKMKNAISKILKDYTVEELKESIDHYAEMYHSDYKYCNYKWGLDTFINREEGCTKFMDDGDKWIRYCDWKKTPKTQPSDRKKVVTKFHNFEQRTDKYSADELDRMAKNLRKKKTKLKDN
ncbi:MAG: hypothetical protein FH761_10415 [Firmicutes bacterium]|nr:hypothetical protein [Bacillota bacterium]